MALVRASGLLDINICCIPKLVDIDIDDKERTAIKLVVELW